MKTLQRGDRVIVEREGELVSGVVTKAGNKLVSVLLANRITLAVPMQQVIPAIH